MASDLKKKLRDGILGKSAAVRSEIVDLPEIGQVELRQPTVAQRDRIYSGAGADIGNLGKSQFGKVLVAAIMECTYVPGTLEQVFESSDADALLSQPTGDTNIVDNLGPRILKLMNVEAPAEGKV